MRKLTKEEFVDKHVDLSALGAEASRIVMENAGDKPFVHTFEKTINALLETKYEEHCAKVEKYNVAKACFDDEKVVSMAEWKAKHN